MPGFVANWFTYDGDNRVLVADGSLQNNQIVITNNVNSGQNAYDEAGNLTLYTAFNTSGQLLSERDSGVGSEDNLKGINVLATVCASEKYRGSGN